MTVLTGKSVDGSVLIHTHELATAELVLNQTSARALLRSGEASIVKGRDVTRPGVLASAGGRKPLDYPSGLTGITDAWGVEFFGRVGIRYSDVNTFSGGSPDRYQFTAGTPGTLQKLFMPYAWPAEMVGSLLVIQEDDRNVKNAAKSQATRIISIGTTTETNDTLNVETLDDTAPQRYNKFHILYPKTFDKRGIWMTNGQQFFLMSGGVRQTYFNSGDSSYIGQRWDMARIHPNTVMFVCDKYPPRVIRLDAEPIFLVSDDLTLAGILPPIKSPEKESPSSVGNDERSWLMKSESGGASTTAGTTRMKVRAINVDDDLYSSFVTVWDESDLAKDSITVLKDEKLICYTKIRAADATPPPFHQRWTHIEVWRSQGDGVSFHLDSTIEIAATPNEYDDLNPSLTAVNSLVSSDEKLGGLSDVDLGANPVLTTEDLVGGGLPPLCRRIVSLRGITVCGGKAASDAEPGATLYSKNWHDGEFTKNGSDAISNVGGFFTNYTRRSGDEFVITDGGAGGATLGVHAILSKIDNTNIQLATGTGPTSAGDVRGYIRRPYTQDYPEIRTDEDLWYSRTDLFAPESFPRRILKLGTIGDELMDMVVVGNYIAVIMRSGVHLVFLTGDGRLTRDTIANFGEGTPWAYSVVTVGSVVIWAHPDGPKTMNVTAEPSLLLTGKRAEIRTVGDNKIRKWFRDAHDNGHDIDTGVDEKNNCIRFRRTDPNDATDFQVLQWSRTTGQWTLLDDDNGIAYVGTVFAEATAKSVRTLYSAGKTGGIFEVNYRDVTHPYDSSTIQAKLNPGELTFSDGNATITRAGEFLARMRGDMIRLQEVDGTIVRRIIDIATVNLITFLAANLDNNSIFWIGANQFQIRFAQLGGQLRTSVKTLQAVNVTARPGARNIGSGNWPSTPVANLTAKMYAEFSDTAYVQKSGMSSDVGIFDESDVTKTSKDRSLGIEAQGAAIELELTCTDTRADFQLDSVEVVVHEEADQVADADTGA